MDIGYFAECMIKWWGDLSYTVWMYFALLLPLTAVIYHLTAKTHRKSVLLVASWFFFFSLSGMLLAANILASLFVWFTGNLLCRIGEDKSLKRKERRKKKKRAIPQSAKRMRNWKTTIPWSCWRKAAAEGSC